MFVHEIFLTVFEVPHRVKRSTFWHDGENDEVIFYEAHAHRHLKLYIVKIVLGGTIIITVQLNSVNK